MAGSLVVGIAEALSAVCVIQAAVPGAPVFICFIPSVMDLKTGDFTGGAPEDTDHGRRGRRRGRTSTACPPSAASTRRGAKLPSWQSALDDTTTTVPLPGRAASTCSPASAWCRAGASSATRRWRWPSTRSRRRATIAHGIDLTGIGGSAGGAAAPAAGPPLVDDQPHRYWAAGGRPTALDRAHERVTRIVAEHRPPALEPALDAELRRLARIG